jgi:hypothetical protein
MVSKTLSAMVSCRECSKVFNTVPKGVLFSMSPIPKAWSIDLRRAGFDALNDLNRIQSAELGSPETITHMAQYEIAFRMQTSVPEVMDIGKEPKHILESYGARPDSTSLANNCLLVRRPVEQGVRFVHLFDWGRDFHGTNPGEALGNGPRIKCSAMAKPVAALKCDLKAQGLLEDTLIVPVGELGRTSFRVGCTARRKTSDGTIFQTYTL